MLLWRFRPGQRVRIRAEVEKLEGVFVLPADAVVREGPECYVFRQDGDRFHRVEVHVVHQDARRAVLARGGDLRVSDLVAQSAAAQLNRVLKAQRTAAAPQAHQHQH